MTSPVANRVFPLQKSSPGGEERRWVVRALASVTRASHQCFMRCSPLRIVRVSWSSARGHEAQVCHHFALSVHRSPSLGQSWGPNQSCPRPTGLSPCTDLSWEAVPLPSSEHRHGRDSPLGLSLRVEEMPKCQRTAQSKTCPHRGVFQVTHDDFYFFTDLSCYILRGHICLPQGMGILLT